LFLTRGSAIPAFIETAMATMPADALNELETIVEGIIALYRRQ